MKSAGSLPNSVVRVLISTEYFTSHRFFGVIAESGVTNRVKLIIGAMSYVTMVILEIPPVCCQAWLPPAPSVAAC